MRETDRSWLLPPAEARHEAASLVAAMAAIAPEILRLEDLALDGALEQQLFFALRDGMPDRAGGLRRAVEPVVRAARTAAGVAASVPGQLTSYPRGAVAVLVREPIHVEALRLIEAELQGTPELVVVSIGRAATAPLDHPRAMKLSTILHPADGVALAVHATRVAARWSGSTRSWPSDDLRRAAREALARVALGAAALNGLARRGPSLIVCFDEIGTWARLVGEVGRRHAIPTLDLPHAEASDPIAIRGVTYDRMAVYGARAAAVLTEAGVASERIIEVGAPRFDPLVRPRPMVPDDGPRRVLFAAQYVTGRMTLGALELTLRAGLAAAAAVAPSELVIRPHPAEPVGQIAGIASGLHAPAGVSVRVESDRSLHDLLGDAWLLVTGWSNSIFEAALAWVPSIAVDPEGRSPTSYADEGLALPATDPSSAASVAASLLAPRARDASVERARAALEAHIGPLDGRASARAAAVMREMATGSP